MPAFSKRTTQALDELTRITRQLFDDRITMTMRKRISLEKRAAELYAKIEAELDEKRAEIRYVAETGRKPPS